MRTLYAELRKRGKGTATIEAVARLLHRVLEVAVDEDRIGRNPAHGVTVAPAPQREARFLTESEVSAIANEVPDRYRALVWALALSGGEAAALRVKHIEGDTIRIVESSAEVRGRKVTGPTKSGKSRTVDVPPELRKMLLEHITTYSNAFDPKALVFPGPRVGSSGRTPSANCIAMRWIARSSLDSA